MSKTYISRTEGDYVVVAWFTPDYSHLAETLATNLFNHNAPYHLYPVESFGKSFFERTRKKPEIVLRAMGDYPDKSIVLMDVDSTVKGDISGMLKQTTGDVGICLKARQIKPPRITLAASSRVAVFKPTAPARAFVETWAKVCADPSHAGHDDELCMLWALMMSPGLSYFHLPPTHSAREEGVACKDAVITHSSENGKRTFNWGIKSGLKAIEKRFFRTGRTQRKLTIPVPENLNF